MPFLADVTNVSVTWMIFALAVSACAILVGSLWSANREAYIRDMQKRMEESIKEITSAHVRGIAVSDMLISKVESIEQVGREDRRELIQLLKEQKRELQELNLDIEQRLTGLINKGAVGVVQVSTGNSAANQAGDNKANRGGY